MPFRPKLIPTLFTIPSLIVLIALGTWQIQRLEWKEGLIEQLQTRAQQAPAPIPEGPLTADEHEFIPVTVTGEFDHAHEFHLVNRALNGEAGINVVTPFRLEDGRTILVNRGWVPFEERDASNRPEAQVTGEQTVTGLLRFVKPQSWIEEQVVPPNEPGNNAWFQIDPDAMARVAGVDSLPDWYVLSGDTNVPGGYPRGQQWRLDIRNDHLQYAITWYSLAIALLVIYVLFHRKPKGGQA